MSKSLAALIEYLSDANLPEYVSPADIGRYLNVSRHTVFVWRSRDLLPPPLPLGPRCLRWPRAVIVEHLIALVEAGTIDRTNTRRRGGRPRKAVAS
jgi:predicted DNA-binding transcriptional regulator AlpA